MKNNWFEVSKEGLRELQEGKPKSYILRELIQNAWDEDIKECKVGVLWDKGIAIISVEDDSPIGFRNLADSYTLFGHTYKRADPTKRGRFNLGEKQAFSICEEAVVESTKGTVIFDKRGRTKTNKKRKAGSRVMLKLKAKKSEYREMLESIKLYHPPKSIAFYVNNEHIKPKEPVAKFKAKLTTELESNGALRRTIRNTDISVYMPNGASWLYEMGIPVTEINCEYSIDVQQKIPLGIDRETVSEAFLKVLYAEVLNHTFEEIKPETSSELWVREAMGSKRINNEAVREVIKKRFGKACIANPFDKNSIDEAISEGFNVIHGSEMSKEEWDNVKQSGALQTTSQLFGAEMKKAKRIKPTSEMKKVAKYAKAIAKKCIGIDIKVEFVEAEGTTTLAQFGDKKLVFNTTLLGDGFFTPTISEKTTDLILHELGHYAGQHTEKSYHELITKMGAKLIMVAINEPKFFKELN